MTIGIVASAAFEEKRTGVEEYVHQVIRHLAMLQKAQEHQFFLYVKSNQRIYESIANLRISSNFKIKELTAPFFWTQGKLALEMLLRKPDVLFVPGHVLPIIHPNNSVVTIHGLEFEYFPEFYPAFHLRYLKLTTRYAVNHAKKIIVVSQNTKDDLMMLYGVDPEQITVIHHGISMPQIIGNQRKSAEAASLREEGALTLQAANISANQRKHQWNYALSPYILFLGTKEKKKNIAGLIKAFNVLREKYKIPHKLVLVGKRPNKRFYKEEKIEEILRDFQYKDDIVDIDFVTEEEKWNLLKNAEIFVYPSFYEGFGMPVLEAQAAGVPVITSNISAMPEVAGGGAALVDPKSIEEMAEAIYKVISDKDLRTDLVRKGYENVKKFSWGKCARETLNLLLK